ncbi:MAG: hypothetical protein LBC91_05150 [Candidatus Accumulibacter sp.]|nr:hypothetical protein [Accumulibacter sp.]
MRNPPKPPSKPRPAKGRRENGPALPDPSSRPDRRWQRIVRYGWDKGGARGGRK